MFEKSISTVSCTIFHPEKDVNDCHCQKVPALFCVKITSSTNYWWYYEWRLICLDFHSTLLTVFMYNFDKNVKSIFTPTPIFLKSFFFSVAKTKSAMHHGFKHLQTVKHQTFHLQMSNRIVNVQANSQISFLQMKNNIAKFKQFELYDPKTRKELTS